VVRGSVTGRDPQAPSTLWIVIIRQHRGNSMLHSASCLELVLLVTLRWYVIPSALGNHRNNQTTRNDRHHRHRRGPAAPTVSRPPRTLTQPEVGAQPTRSKRQVRGRATQDARHTHAPRRRRHTRAGVLAGRPSSDDPRARMRRALERWMPRTSGAGGQGRDHAERAAGGGDRADRAVESCAETLWSSSGSTTPGR
jgi:hypothetical protein